MISKKQNF